MTESSKETSFPRFQDESFKKLQTKGLNRAR